jgi:hypothetical protein
MLTFTGKGLLFTAGLAALTTWGFTAATLTHNISAWTGWHIDAYAVFAAGTIAGPSLVAMLLLIALGRTYRGMDPIEDTPC